MCTAPGCIFRFNFWLLSGVSYSDECRTKKKLFSMSKNVAAFSCCREIATHCNCMTGLGYKDVGKGNFGGLITPICRHRRLLSNQSSDKVSFPRIPTSTSTNSLLQICRQAKYLLQICRQSKFWVWTPIAPDGYAPAWGNMFPFGFHNVFR